MKIKGICWLGAPAAQFEPMLDFCQDILGLTPSYQEPGFAVFDLPNKDKFELFGPESGYNKFMTHPVAAFLVDDIYASRAEMEARGVEFIEPIHAEEDGYAWTNFRAPDGFVYSLTYDPRHPALRI